MESKNNRKVDDTVKLPQFPPSSRHQFSEAQTISPNEAAVPLGVEELFPHVRIIKPSRPSLTYDRIE